MLTMSVRRQLIAISLQLNRRYQILWALRVSGIPFIGTLKIERLESQIIQSMGAI